MSINFLNLPAIEINSSEFQFIAANDEQEIQVFLEDCSDFSMLESGKPTQPGDGYKLLTALPPDTTPDQKIIVFVEQCGIKVGLVELIANYPEKGIWWIGLLLIRPNFRGKSLGKQIVDVLGRAMADSNAREIRLGVLENNPDAYRFWLKNCFKKLFSKTDQVIGTKTHTVYVLGKKLSV